MCKMRKGGYGVDPDVSQPSQGTATLVSGLRGSHLRTFRHSVLWTREKTGSFQSEPQPVIRGWNKSDSVQYLCIYSTRMYVCVCFLNFVLSADCPLHCTPSLGKKKESVLVMYKETLGGWVGGWVGGYGWVWVCVCVCVRA